MTRRAIACACVAMLAQPAAAAEVPQFFPLNDGRAVSYVSSGTKFFPLRPSSTTLRPRVITPPVQAAAPMRSVEVRPTLTQTTSTTASPPSPSEARDFKVERYQPRPRAVFRLRNQQQDTISAAPVRSVSSTAVAPLPKDNHGNRELASNAPYSSSFYGASHIGLTEHSWPMDLATKQRVSSGFGMRRHPVTGSSAFHKGVDIAAPIGSAVRASADGVVEETGQDGLIGKFVRLRHPDGSQSLYGHLSAIYVKEADWLTRNQNLGAVGNTGRTTGSHLHFALNVDGQAMDPMQYLGRPEHEVASR